MKIRVFVYCLIVLLFFGFPSRGQEGKELTAKMEAIFQILKPADRKALTEGYVATMTSPGLSDDDKALVASVFQYLQDLHVTVTPELKNYILCVNHFSQRGEKSNLLVWLGGMQKALASTDRKRSVVKSYLESTTALACDRMLFNGSSHQWQVKGDINWHAGDPVRIDFREGDLVYMTRKDTIRVKGTGGVCLLGTDVLDAEGKLIKRTVLRLTRNRVLISAALRAADWRTFVLIGELDSYEKVKSLKLKAKTYVMLNVVNHLVPQRSVAGDPSQALDDTFSLFIFHSEGSEAVFANQKRSFANQLQSNANHFFVNKKIII